MHSDQPGVVNELVLHELLGRLDLRYTFPRCTELQSLLKCLNYTVASDTV